MPDDLLNAAGAAKALAVHVNTLKRLVKSGELEAFRIGKRGDIRVSRGTIDRYLATHKAGPR